MSVVPQVHNAARIERGFTERTSCQVCKQCWKRPGLPGCLYGGPFTGYTTKTVNELKKIKLGIDRAVKKIDAFDGLEIPPFLRRSAETPATNDKPPIPTVHEALSGCKPEAPTQEKADELDDPQPNSEVGF